VASSKKPALAVSASRASRANVNGGHHQDDMNERSARANVCSGTSLESIDISGEFGSSRKDTHWGRLKLKRDQQ
jgi:hypothetical protein